MTSNKNAVEHKLKQWLREGMTVVSPPMLVIITACSIYFFFVWFLHTLFQKIPNKIWIGLYTLLQIIIIACLFWLFLRLILLTQRHLQKYIEKYSEKNTYHIAAIILPFLGNCLKVIILLSLLPLLVNTLPLPEQYIYLIEKSAGLLIITVIAWLLLRLTQISGQFMTIRYQTTAADMLAAQKAQTQILILKRMVNGIIIIVALGAALMLFDTVRELGASILASAGIAGIIAGFAAQKFLANILISLQLILNQIIKINDYVIIENEFGQIEALTLNYAVVKTWDLRRLILPIQYFAEKPFQNLSWKSTNIIGIVFLYTDYTLPVATIRETVTAIIKDSPLWDKQVCILQVTDLKESCMELRILASAQNPGNAWNLRCDIREKLLAFILKHYPQSLAHTRVELRNS